MALQQEKASKEALLQEKDEKSKEQCQEANSKNERDIEVQALRDKLQEESFNNRRLTQQVQYLQETISETKKQNKGGLLDRVWSGGAQSQELHNTLQILQEELQVKIEENENIHISNYEEKKQMEEEVKLAHRDKLRFAHACEGAETALKKKDKEVN